MKTQCQYVEDNEGFSRHIYLDSEGIETIGIGFNLEHGFTLHECRMILTHRISILQDRLAEVLDVFDSLNDVRKLVLVDMSYNLGLHGLLKFKKMIAALEAEDFNKAAEELLDSKYARQVGKRARKNARLLSTGEWYE